MRDVPTNEYVLQYEVSSTAYEASEATTSFLKENNFDLNDKKVYKLFNEAHKNYSLNTYVDPDHNAKRKLQKYESSARFSDIIAVIDDYPITRRHYFDILLLIEDYICNHSLHAKDAYLFKIPASYFSCSKIIDCINDPE